MKQVLFSEPKDKIELENPKADMDFSEETINYVAEYVYDSKLQKDEIHKTIWETLRDKFKQGVEEFSDCRNCHEKNNQSLGGNANSRKDTTGTSF